MLGAFHIIRSEGEYAGSETVLIAQNFRQDLGLGRDHAGGRATVHQRRQRGQVGKPCGRITDPDQLCNTCLAELVGRSQS